MVLVVRLRGEGSECIVQPTNISVMASEQECCPFKRVAIWAQTTPHILDAILYEWHYREMNA